MFILVKVMKTGDSQMELDCALHQRIHKISEQLAQIYQQFNSYLPKIRAFSQISIEAHEINTAGCLKQAEILISCLVSTMENLVQYSGRSIDKICKQLLKIETEIVSSNKLVDSAVCCSKQEASYSQISEGYNFKYLEDLCKDKSLTEIFPQNILNILKDKMKDEYLDEPYILGQQRQNEGSETIQILQIPFEMKIYQQNDSNEFSSVNDDHQPNKISQKNANIIERQVSSLEQEEQGEFDQQNQQQAEQMRSKYSTNHFGAAQNNCELKQQSNCCNEINKLNEQTIPPYKYFDLMEQRNNMQEMVLRLSTRLRQKEFQLQELNRKNALLLVSSEEERQQKTMIIQRVQEKIEKYQQKLEEMAIANQEKQEEICVLDYTIKEQQEYIKALNREQQNFQEKLQDNNQQFDRLHNQLETHKTNLENQIDQKNSEIRSLELELFESTEGLTNQLNILSTQNQDLKEANDFLKLQNEHLNDHFEAVKMQYKEAMQRLIEVEESGVMQLSEFNTELIRKSRTNSNRTNKSRINRKRRVELQLDEKNSKVHKQLVERLEDGKKLIEDQQILIEALTDEIKAFKSYQKEPLYSQYSIEEYDYLRAEFLKLEQQLQDKQLLIKNLKAQFETKLLAQITQSIEKSASQSDIKLQSLLTLETANQNEYTEKLQKIIIHYQMLLSKTLKSIGFVQEEFCTFIQHSLEKETERELIQEELQELEQQLQLEIRQKEKLEEIAFSSERIINFQSSLKNSKLTETERLRQILENNSWKHQYTDDESQENWAQVEDIPIRNKIRRSFYQNVLK